MNRELFRMVVGVLAVLVIALSSTAFTVREEHTALVTRFGKLVETVEEPGLHWKLPWPIDRAIDVDGRTRLFNTRHSETLTGDKKNVILLSYAVWRVADPELFYKAVGTIEEADRKLDGVVTNAKIGVLGRYDLAALVSTTPEDLKGDQIEAEILAAVDEAAREKYGIEIRKVGFKRLSLPEENIEAVFGQMRAERRKVADGLRAQGESEAAKVRSETDVETAEIKAEAREEAARLRGEAEAEAASIYAAAHGAEPGLFAFLRKLESLEAILGPDAAVILRTDQAPFDVLHGIDAHSFSTRTGKESELGNGSGAGDNAEDQGTGDGQR